MSEPKKINSVIADTGGIDNYVDQLLTSRTIYRTKPIPGSFINAEYNVVKEFIKRVFIKCDPYITDENFKWIPEYDILVDYLQRTDNDGLIAHGESGTGKSNIIKYVIPLCFQMREKVVFPTSCYDLHEPDIYRETRLRRHILLDEMGVEKNVSINKSFTETFNPVERLISLSEDENKAFFGSTNLTIADIYKKYGKRNLGRVIKRCRIIEFKTKSLR